MVISSNDDKFTYEDLEKAYSFLKTSNFSKIYNEFNDKNGYDPQSTQYCNQIKSSLDVGSYNDEILLSFCNILYKIIVHVNNISNDHFEGISKNDKMYCICLKYWLYEKIGNVGAMGLGTSELFGKYQENIKSKAKKEAPNPCKFSVLEWNEIDKLSSIYAFILFYYSNINSFYGEKNIPCKYMNYFGKGLKTYNESLNMCSSEKKGDNYCKEFREFKETYGLDKIYWETSKVYEKYTYDPNNSTQCALNIESHNNPLHLTYWHENEKLHLSNQPIDFQKSAIISSSSAIGTTLGVSAFLLYLYKYTSLGSLFRARIQKNTVILNNMDRENHDNAFPTYEYENTSVENGDYNISYYSLNNS
ncbi:PIR Superfamily Protein [Plasmodium ovale wallikeri]|uniref:PIR Superfamily Protein n=1 Tax=Plasmodium ovale wallikeri TaxID=864142 RepID=A0A1A9ACG0_PLAOA|nr:PIR Superfamily Protein [Plasmodium ovale wallikeri]